MITNRRFGIEIEFVGADSYRVANAINDAGINCQVEGWNHVTRAHWKITTDSSLRHSSGYTGELVSPILKGQAGFEQLRKVVEVLNSIPELTVNRSCGLHIHLDATDLSANECKTIFERYAEYETQIDLVMPRSRRGDARWCAGLARHKSSVKNSRDRSQLVYAMGNNAKFHKVNLTNLTGRNSIEFRQHSGTTDFRKISNWLGFLMAFVEKSREVAGNVTRPRARTGAKSRWFNAVRNAFENAGYDMTWSRRTKSWVITRQPTVPMGNEPIVVGFLTNDEIRACYNSQENSVVRTSRANGDWVNTYALTTQTRRLGIDICGQYDSHTGRWNVNYENTTASERVEETSDEGWLDGVAQSIVNYMAEREEELN